MRYDARFFFFWGGGGLRPWQAGEARSAEGTREISRDQGSELSDATIVPQGDVIADVARSEDKLILIPVRYDTRFSSWRRLMPLRMRMAACHRSDLRQPFLLPSSRKRQEGLNECEKIAPRQPNTYLYTWSPRRIEQDPEYPTWAWLLQGSRTRRVRSLCARADVLRLRGFLAAHMGHQRRHLGYPTLWSSYTQEKLPGHTALRIPDRHE